MDLGSLGVLAEMVSWRGKRQGIAQEGILRLVMRPVADELAFGKLTSTQAGKEVVSRANAIL